MLIKMSINSTGTSCCGNDTAVFNNKHCGLTVASLAHCKLVMEPYVFHMQHSKMDLKRAYFQSLGRNCKGSALSNVIQALVAIFLVGATGNTAVAADKACINYYTVGESNCRPTASTPVERPAERPQALSTAAKPQSDVDKYLADYGKPPREFVEFYLNPTPENATKWVSAYQQLLQKGQTMSKAWDDADQLYKAQQQTVVPVLQVPQSLVPESEPEAAPQPVSKPAVQVPAPSFGGIAERMNMVKNTPAGMVQPLTSLVYYFSQTCPYCARTTPELTVISSEFLGKLAFTCVDVTPVGASSRPDESYITSKLPCNWRLPESGEVEREGVRQTPTLVIQKPGSSPVRLSGYVPLTQLRSYF